ncbi:hypothetical protein FNH05_05590 [Amycolatopsis rhizosphaerae]|uniref:Sodium/calcium exchanger membrane region domain-containing protein n=1 Tax=Amycolatopsis rhizosphaerae TaxID=2053003 RepID=A0A558DEA3_9PSEU|nr:hypothetical protein [Amycolatopsis rhizosphaerae]TVT59348.1 hypothetical protein FNH05_05590 [Amycolatopsis rhizosphaerae]
MADSVDAAPGPVGVFRNWGVDGWLWACTALSAVVAASVHFTAGSDVAQFLASLAGVAFTSAVMSRTLDQLSGRLSRNAVGLFQAVTGNIPEFVIGAFALFNHLDVVVLGTIAGSALNLLLFANGLAYIAGGVRHRVLAIDTQAVLSTCVMLVLMVTVLVMPAVAVQLHSPAEHHQQAVSYTVAVVLLVTFVIALPENLRSSSDGPGPSIAPGQAWLAGFGTAPPPPTAPVPPRQVGGEAVPRWPLRRTLALLGVAGLLLAEEADWLTKPMAGALTSLHISQAFAGLFLLAVVNNLSQVAPSVRLAWRGDIDTAIAINLQGTLQLVLMVAPLLMLLTPLAADHQFTLIFSPLMAVAMVVATLLVVFVVLDAIANVLEGAMLIGLYAVLASLFAWS